MSQNGSSQIEAMLAQLRQEYLLELPSRITELENLILESRDEENYQELYRQIHSMKGSGGTHGLDILSFVCHQLEEELDKIHTEHQFASEPSKQRILAYLDILKNIQELALDGQTAFNEIRDKLQGLRSESTGKNAEILVVEPSPSFAQLIRESLSDLAVNVTITDSGLKGLDLALHRIFDVVITAKETNTLNGTAMVAALKSCKRYTNNGIKSILISSNVQSFEKSGLVPDHVLKRDIKLGDALHDIIAGHIHSLK